MIGAKHTTTTGLTDWNHVVLNSKPPNVRSTFLSANIVNDDPACSNADQKNITNTAMTYITPICFFSLTVNPLSVIMNIGNTIEKEYTKADI